jgi:SAM-dependent methyltransferase
MEFANQLDPKRPLSILDLGCGIGRNSIPLAELISPSSGRIQCVDLLDMEILRQSSRQHQVEHVINTEQADISEYKIPRNSFDYIVAVCLEQVKSENIFKKILRRMTDGTKSGGINYIMMNTNFEEIERHTGNKLETRIEVMISKGKALAALHSNYAGWEEIHSSDIPRHLEISRNDVPIIVKADSLTLAVRKP